MELPLLIPAANGLAPALQSLRTADTGACPTLQFRCRSVLDYPFDDRAEFVVSQLPFGFDVNWYPRGSELHKTAATYESQLPFGFDVNWYLPDRPCQGFISLGSQLPFGFDVNWYLTRKMKESAAELRLNCLSALMSIGTGAAADATATVVEVSIAFRL